MNLLHAIARHKHSSLCYHTAIIRMVQHAILGYKKSNNKYEANMYQVTIFVFRLKIALLSKAIPSLFDKQTTEMISTVQQILKKATMPKMRAIRIH